MSENNLKRDIQMGRNTYIDYSPYYIENKLLADGYERTDYETDGDKVWITYRRGKDEAILFYDHFIGNKQLTFNNEKY